MVVTRETRDLFLNYLHKITSDNTNDTIQGQGQRPTTGPTRLDEDVEQVFCDNTYSKQSVTSINEFNKSTKDITERNFESTMKELDNIQNQFTEHDLKKTLNTEEQFDKLKSIQKKITQFHVACTKTLKAVSLQTNTRKHYICQMQKKSYPKQNQTRSLRQDR